RVPVVRAVRRRAARGVERLLEAAGADVAPRDVDLVLLGLVRQAVALERLVADRLQLAPELLLRVGAQALDLVLPDRAVPLEPRDLRRPLLLHYADDLEQFIRLEGLEAGLRRVQPRVGPRGLRG